MPITINNQEDIDEIYKNLIPAITFEGYDPDEKRYLLLLELFDYNSTEENQKDWKIATGRQAIYDEMKNLVITEAINPNRSYIIPLDDNGDDNIIINNAIPITISRFMKMMREQGKVLDGDESFDIDEYIDCSKDLTMLEL